MRTVLYKSLLEGVLKMAGEDAAEAQSADKAKFAEFLDQGLSDAHEYWRWPELVNIERRFFRPTHVLGTVYAAGAEIYDPASQAYYRALRTATNQAPASLSDGEYSVNDAYWWQCVQALEASDWAASTDYLVGTQVRNPSDGLFYACHTAHTSGASFDSSKFGEIVSFRPYIAYEQTGQTEIEAVLACYSADPRSDLEATLVDYSTDADGIRFAADQEGPVWVEFRVRCPDYNWSEEWEAGAYAADAVVYHEATGEVYKASAAAAETDVPGTAAVWVRQQVPYIFRHVAKWKALARWHEAEGQTDKALVHEGKFTELLDEQVWQYTKLQGQTGRPNVLPTPR